MDTTKVLTKQEIFDKVWNGFVKQGWRPATKEAGSGVCSYRTEDGRKCAAGQLILDSTYHQSMEGLGVDAGIVRNALGASGVGEENMPLVWALQRVHDNVAAMTRDSSDEEKTYYLHRQMLALGVALGLRDVA